MTIYVSRRNENVTARLDEAYTTEQTVMLEHLTGDKAGKTTPVTHSTLKRWWKAVEVQEDITEVVMEQKKELGIEVPVINPEDVKVMNTESELSDEEYAKIGLEIAEQAKKKAISHKKSNKASKVDRTSDIEAIDAFIGNTYDTKYYESVKCYKIMKAGKPVAEIYPRKKEIEVRVKSIRDNFDSDIRYKDGYKYYLPVHYFIDYSTDYIRLISNLIQ